MKNEFLSVTELAGDDVTQEQVDRFYHRYYWAGKLCNGKDVLEIACGSGQGLNYLLKMSKSLQAGDYSKPLLNIALSNYGDKIPLKQFDACNMPYKDNSIDVIILFEAIYYLSSASDFVAECKRVLRKNGSVLICTANKDLYDFNPSPYSYKYYGPVELTELFSKQNFTTECFGAFPANDIHWLYNILRPIKKTAVNLNLIPRSMNGKKLIKRLIFGKLVKMPEEINDDMFSFVEPVRIPAFEADLKHLVIYCVAKLKK
jgi:ubiquinone/menaquinone biosynthesis C-methylase UbiE